MNSIELSPWQLSGAASLLVLMAACAHWQRIQIAKATTIAAIRMALQLCLLGLVLETVFTTKDWGWVALIAIAMLLAAGREVVARQERKLSGWWGFSIGTTSMFVSSFAICLLTLTTIIRADPWYQPQYAIPILGMLLGNTMNGISLVLDRITEGVWTQRDVIEQRLMLGQTSKEAFKDISSNSVRAGMMPIINSMAVAGLVSLPGMMTGQILAGVTPFKAVKYQILIWLLIGAGSGLGMMVTVHFVTKRLFDQRHRLRLDRLSSPQKQRY